MILNHHSSFIRLKFYFKSTSQLFKLYLLPNLKMLRIFLLAAAVCAASAGLIGAPTLTATGVTSYAAGPALGAPLLGRVTVNPAEVTVHKQPITVDQPEIRYRSVPTVVGHQVVQTAPIVRDVYAAPQIVATQHVLAAPQHIVAHPQLFAGHQVVQTLGQPTITLA